MYFWPVQTILLLFKFKLYLYLLATQSKDHIRKLAKIKTVYINTKLNPADHSSRLGEDL